MTNVSEQHDKIKVTGEFTPDPNVCLFKLDRTVLEGWTLIFRNPDESIGSPLVDALFGVEGIVKVQVSQSVITLTKSVATPWPQLATPVVAAIRETLSSGQSAISAEVLAAVEEAAGQDVGGAIEQLLDEQINPSLASHGGYVKLVKVEDNDVYLEMGGGCQGCAASQATLRHGVETAIRDIAPQIRNIIDVTDHAAGENPYYS